MGNFRNSNINFVENHENMRLLGRSIGKQENDIKMDLKRIG
jgi:hypothetical protein